MKRLLYWLWLPFACGILWAGYYGLARNSRGTTSTISGGSIQRANTPRPTPVAASPATLSAFDVYLTGLGNVSPFNTVTVKSLVDGELIRVAFEEGQHIHEGDWLAEIDPRPFEVQLEQAQAQLAKDQSQVGQAEFGTPRSRNTRKLKRTATRD